MLQDVSSHDEHFSIKAAVKVTNSGEFPGSCVVQLYVSLPDVGATTPRLQLKGFAKTKDLAPRATQNVDIFLNKYAIAETLPRTNGAPRLACTACSSCSTARSHPCRAPLSSEKLSRGVACKLHVLIRHHDQNMYRVASARDFRVIRRLQLGCGEYNKDVIYQ